MRGRVFTWLLWQSSRRKLRRHFAAEAPGIRTDKGSVPGTYLDSFAWQVAGLSRMLWRRRLSAWFRVSR